jgi:hypothetical protein
MKVPSEKLLTPIYVKVQPDMPWPEERAFYLMTSDGLFLCRNHPFFSSSVPVRNFPAELAGHEPSLRISYPKLPQRMLERVVGFFARVGLLYGAEAIVLLAWHKGNESLELIVPDQCSIVSTNWHGEPIPIEVHYETPKLPPHLMLIGDLHSHVDGPAYASATDREDELHRPGLHVVVGRLMSREPPEFHLELTVDGVRFKVKDPSAILAGYHRRRMNEVPAAWLNKVTVKSWSPPQRTYWEDDEKGRTFAPVEDTRADSGAAASNGQANDEPANSFDVPIKTRPELAGPPKEPI